MSTMQPIILYGHGATPNPVKVAIILEELSIPYVVKEIPDMKAEPFITLNPNGRAPAIEDPNTGIALFESGAIIEYLVDKYDKEGRLKYTSDKEKYLTQSWLHFQVSGQGPYFGQRVWFAKYHSEQLPSAIERYGKEVKRVTSVIDARLAKEKTRYLVGDKLTYADMAFVPWFRIITMFMADELDTAKEFPTFHKWFAELVDRDSVKTVVKHPDLQFKQ